MPQIILSGALIPPSKVNAGVGLVFDLAIAKWGYELAAGQICGINSRAAIDPLPDLDGFYSANWLVLLAFLALFMILAAKAMKRKDSQKDRG